MKSALKKNAFIEIFKTKSRFLSIFGIVAIGISFFAGVKNSSPDMKLCSDSYYKEHNLAHFRLISTFGFADEDIEALEAAEGIKIYPGYFADVIIENGEGGDRDDAARVMSLKDYGKNNEATQLELVEGRFPEKADECIVDSGGLLKDGNSIGKRLLMKSGDENPLSDTLKITEYTVVGTFISPAYIDMSSRGNTTIGNGNISGIIYINEENFKTEVYTEIYAVADSLLPLSAYSSEYDQENERVRLLLEDIGGNREIERYDEILAEAGEEIEKAEKELEDGKKEADEKLADAKKELDDAKAEIEKAEAELEDAKKELEEGRKTLDDSRDELDRGWSELRKGETEFNDQINQAQNELNANLLLLNSSRREYEAGWDQYKQGLSEYEEGLSQYNALSSQKDAAYEAMNAYYGGQISADELLETWSAIGVPPAEFTEQFMSALEASAEIPNYSIQNSAEVRPEFNAALAYLEQLSASLEQTAPALEESKRQLDEAKAELDAAKLRLDEAEGQLKEGEETLEAEKIRGEQELAASREALNNGEAEYKKGVEDYRQGELDYADGVKKITEGKDDYKKGLKEYEDAKKEAEEEIAEGEQKIRDAKRELEDIQNPEWYVFDRSGNPGYSEYGENAQRINNIASVFPIFFILVAALVCLTTMTRMVEEQRSQIGTLKALGYTNGQIAFKYLFYALSATFLGSFIGAVAGQKLFPFVIITAYGMMYDIPLNSIPTDWLLTTVCTAVAMAAVALTVYFSCKSELSEEPAQLMRPKAPRAGKMILLDKLPFWQKVGFNGKVTARNLFRYKRRMFMTVVGVAGCTALTLVGFALENSISDIINKQYGELNSYTGILAYDSVDSGDTEKIESLLADYGCEKSKYMQKKLTVSHEGKTTDTYLIVPESKEELQRFYCFKNRITGERYDFSDNTVLIDEKTSLLLGIKIGDAVELYQDETDRKTVTVSGAIENYPQHYTYMSEALYEEIFGEQPEYNMIAFGGGKAEETLAAEEQRDKFAAELLETKAVMAVNYRVDMIVTMSSMLDALNYVVIVLIVSAGALAFVVLYNL
ncbi:MAG: FtsX-like permease family protein, partial [[Eubacterium] siraeum]|nr:FtsX-like permease family protein [[Eubacterium] siraeum]